MSSNGEMDLDGIAFEKALEAGLPKFSSGPIRVAIEDINCFLPMQEQFGDEKNMSDQSRIMASMSDTHCLMFPENVDTNSPQQPGQIIEIKYTHVNGARWSGGLFGSVTQSQPLPGYDMNTRARGREAFEEKIKSVATSLLEPDGVRGHRIKIAQGNGKDILEGNV